MLSTFALALPAVLFIVDPIGVVPLFVAMTANDSPDKCRGMALRAVVTATGVLTFFALFGSVLFHVFSVTLAAFRVAGGILLMLTALDMLRGQHPGTKTSAAETAEGVGQDDIAIVPLAMPLLAGPGAIATVMVLMSQHGGGVDAAVPVIASILITMLLAYVTLRSAQGIKRVLKQTGIAILERIFGLILAAIAVQFVFEGGKELLRS
ncbi:MAG: MarC family protein [Myxococcaceae bacterium]